MAIELVDAPTVRRGGVVPYLEVVESDRVVLAYPLRSAATVLGRTDQADLALPSDTVSRVHCVVEQRGDGWWVTDRSRNGTLLDGQPVDEALLAPGATLHVGRYRVRFVEGPLAAVQAPTHTRMVTSADHEELVGVSDGVAAWRAELRVVGGPRRGLSVALNRRRTLVGGEGADVYLSAELPPDALVLRAVRGRPLAEPGSHPVLLAGQRLREATPLHDGDVLRLGDHELDVVARMVELPARRLEGFGELVGTSDRMQQLFGVLDRVARHDATVLLVGESGTGKELAARAVHEAGPRHDGPFVAVNCAALPSELVESELFGHEVGAFTGAVKRQDGAFQRADGGTLFLDELGELSAAAQAKLLRALESGEVRRVGGKAAEFPDVRVIAATHANLARLVDDGRFRQDLLYRIAVLTLAMPALRQHAADVPEIARVLLARHHPGARLTREAVEALCAYTWPGNVRELRNVLTRAVVLHGDRIEAHHLSFHPWAFDAVDASPGWDADAGERGRLEDALRQAGGNKSEAARLLGIARTSLLYKLQKHGIRDVA